MRIVREYIKAHKFGLSIVAITLVVSAFIGVLGGKLIPVRTTKQEIVHDTLYVNPSKTDSLLLEISYQVKEINTKLPVGKLGGNKRTIKKDTLTVDAVIHLEEGE